MSLETLGGLGTGHDAGKHDAGKPDQRNEDRLLLTSQPAGRLTVCTPFARLEARHVRDVSRSGISLEIDRPVGRNASVSVEYVDPKMNITVNGRLAWSRENEAAPGVIPGSAYVVGIELFSPGLLLNFLPTSVQG